MAILHLADTDGDCKPQTGPYAFLLKAFFDPTEGFIYVCTHPQ